LGVEGLKDVEESRRLLETYQDDFLPGESKIHGKVGGGETPGQLQIMMHCDTVAEAGAYTGRNERLAQKTSRTSAEFIFDRTRVQTPVPGTVWAGLSQKGKNGTAESGSDSKSYCGVPSG
jgi:hypothetical protein